MSTITLKTWRQKDADLVWELGLPINLFRNKTHLRQMISRYRKLRQAEVYLVLNQKGLIYGLLFMESIFLDPRTLIGNLMPLTGQENYFDPSKQQTLNQVGAAYFDLNPYFDQLILQIPNEKEIVIPGSEPAIYLGDSIYPNRFETKQYAAADFLLYSFLLFTFKKHHIAVSICSNKIVRVEFIQPGQQITNHSLKQALAKDCYLNESGEISTDQGIVELLSKRDQINIELKLKIIKQFTDYFSGKLKEFTLPFEFNEGTDFQRRVWQILAKIPYGSVLSYEEVAQQLTGNSKKAYAYARAVGSACGKNPIGIIIPCHRVIGKDRSLTGFGGGVKLKGHLLDLEFMGRSSG